MSTPSRYRLVSISAGGIFAKHHAGEYEPLDVIGVHLGSGMVIIFVVTLAVEGGPVSETALTWSVLAYMALASTVLPMVLYYWLLRKVTATYAALVGYVIPIIAVTAGVLVLDEQVQPGILLGGVVIFLGVIIADRAERRPVSTPAAVD